MGMTDDEFRKKAKLCGWTDKEIENRITERNKALTEDGIRIPLELDLEIQDISN